MPRNSPESVCAAIVDGRAVVVPNPAPLAYGVVASKPAVVNTFKGRPPDQNVGVSVHDPSHWRELRSVVDLPEAVRGGVLKLLQRRFTVLVPVSGETSCPDWAVPAIRDGWLAVFDGSWPELAWLWDRFPLLYGSSANVTGSPAAASAQEARAMFGDDCIVAPAGEDADSGPRRSSAMVRVLADGHIELHRSGAQDREAGLPERDFLRRLATDTVG